MDSTKFLICKILFYGAILTNLISGAPQSREILDPSLYLLPHAPLPATPNELSRSTWMRWDAPFVQIPNSNDKAEDITNPLLRDDLSIKEEIHHCSKDVSNTEVRSKHDFVEYKKVKPLSKVESNIGDRNSEEILTFKQKNNDILRPMHTLNIPDKDFPTDEEDLKPAETIWSSPTNTYSSGNGAFGGNYGHSPSYGFGSGMIYGIGPSLLQGISSGFDYRLAQLGLNTLGPGSLGPGMNIQLGSRYANGPDRIYSSGNLHGSQNQWVGGWGNGKWGHYGEG